MNKSGSTKDDSFRFGAVKSFDGFSIAINPTSDATATTFGQSQMIVNKMGLRDAITINKD
jgi:hypothetical protein